MSLAFNNIQQPIVLEAALSHAKNGRPVIPLFGIIEGRCECELYRREPCKSPGKHPRFKDWLNRATTVPDIINGWWQEHPRSNVGIVTGESSGILLLDVDLKDDGPEHLAELEKRYGPLPHTAESITGSGGRHILFKYSPGRDIPNKARFYPGLDTRSNGGMFVAPGSLHVSGRRYEWEVEHHPDDVPLAEAPEWLLKLMERQQAHKAAQPVSDYIKEGERNSTLTSLAGTMRRRGMSREAITAALEAENKKCIPPLTRDEVQKIADSVCRYEPAENREGLGFSLTDLGNARRLVSQHGKDIHYCYTWGCWLIWNGKLWVKDRTGQIYRLAKETVASIYFEAAQAVDSEERKALAKHATRSESEARIKAMVSLAESEPGIAVTPDQLDSNPWLLNCSNGTIDLRTGELKPHSREDLITKLTPVNYDMHAECPTWIAFLDKILQGNVNLRKFLQKVIGYCLTGDTREQALFFLYGTGANGKSTLINILLSLLGDYSLQTPTEMLMMSDRGGIPNDIARLKGARFVTAVEAGEGRRMAEVLVKQLTGGDTITARFLHQEFFEFKPQCKIFLAANHKPIIKGTDHAIWRRIKMIPFTVTIPEEEQDKHLLDKLKSELSGILAWAVKGCLAWQQLGLGTPDEVKVATEGYRAEMDVIAGFIDECCHVHPAVSVQASAIYEAYCKWCKENGEEAQNQKKFGMALTEKGFIRDRGTGNRNIWRGIGLVDIPGERSWVKD